MASKFLASAPTASMYPVARPGWRRARRGLCGPARGQSPAAPASRSRIPMEPRRHLISRGYAAVVIALRHLIPLAWIAAVVLATVTLPDLASAPTAPLEDLAAKNGAASQAQARSIERFGCPLATQTAVVQRDPRGLSPEARRRQLLAARTVVTHQDPSLRDIRAALPIANIPRGGRPPSAPAPARPPRAPADREHPARRAGARARHHRGHLPLLPERAVARPHDGRRAPGRRPRARRPPGRGPRRRRRRRDRRRPGAAGPVQGDLRRPADHRGRERRSDLRRRGDRVPL